MKRPLRILLANSDTSHFQMSIISLAMCADTLNLLLLDRHIIFIQQAEEALGELSAPSMGGREASSFDRQALIIAGVR